jgi:hypothetical protein
MFRDQLAPREDTAAIVAVVILLSSSPFDFVDFPLVADTATQEKV